MKESPEFATSVGYPGQNDRWSDISFEAIARHKETDKLDLELIKSIDLRAFHDEVLKNGALPMSALETHMKEWIAKGKGA
jgi:hypothetical protein